MKILQDFGDYQLDLLVEAITQKEIPLIFSDRFRNLIHKIDHPISTKLLNAERNSENQKSSFIDLDDSDLDKISFITSTKAAEVIADVKGINKDEKDIEFSPTTYIDVKYSDFTRTAMYSKYRSVTSIGKLINKLFPKEFPPSGKPGEDIQSFTNKFKSGRDMKALEEVTGDDIVTYYSRDSYINGEQTDGSLGNSCMRYDECDEYIQFYADNPKVCSLLILRDEENPDKIKGRALVWKLSEPYKRTFMDRIYTADGYDEELFKSYAKKNGWLYKYRQNSGDGEQIVDTEENTQDYMTLVVSGVKESSTDKYPYVDTLRYFYHEDGILSSDSDRGGAMWTLQDTEGGYEADDEGRYVDFYGRSYPEDDLIYCELGDDYRLEDDAVYLEFYGKSATEEYMDRHMIQCDYYESNYGGSDAMRERGDTVEVYGSGEEACSRYASDNLPWSDYHNEYLPPNKGVWSEHHETYIYEPEAVEVYITESQSKTDWRAEDDDTWWEWDEDGEKYDENISEEELREYNGLNDEEDEDEEDEDDEVNESKNNKSLEYYFEEMYDGLTEEEGDLMTQSDFVNGNGIKKLEYGFDPNGFHSGTICLFFYWWDMTKIDIHFDLEEFESELLGWFNKTYNKEAEKVVALYVGTTQQKEKGTY